MGKLTAKVAMITGAGRGIGRAIALAYAGEGASVTIASRSSETVAAVVAEVEALGGDAIGVTCDVASRAHVADAVEQTVARFGGLDILVNNAQAFGTAEHPEASAHFMGIETFPEDVWDYTFQTGLKGTLYGMQAAFPYLREHGGKVINMGSGNGIANLKGTAAYNATKEAIRSLTRTAAAEWGKYGINVNVIVPTMRTDAAEDFFRDRPNVEEQIVAQIPMRRLGDVTRDIGPVAVFLASSDSDYITGATVHVDGGQIMRP
jgi:2-hydroxycyclohexanecarboxyl-CoA dehydrogenase